MGKVSKTPPHKEAGFLLSHKWFRNQEDRFLQAYENNVLRKYDSWRVSVRLRTFFVKIMADCFSLASLAILGERLATLADSTGNITWSRAVQEIVQLAPITSLLEKVNRAFEGEFHSGIRVEDMCHNLLTWRQKRVREVLWQMFARAKEFGGVLSAEAFEDGFNGAVYHVWSRPMRVIDVIYPSDPYSKQRLIRLQEMLANRSTVTFSELLPMTDAMGPGF